MDVEDTQWPNVQCYMDVTVLSSVTVHGDTAQVDDMTSFQCIMDGTASSSVTMHVEDIGHWSYVQCYMDVTVTVLSS